MRVTRRVRHILSIPFLTKRPSFSDTKYKDTAVAATASATTATATTTATTTTPTATAATSTTLTNDTDDAVHLHAQDFTDTKSSSTFDDDDDDDVISDETESRTGSGSGSGSGSEHTSRKPRVRIITWHLDDSPSGGCRWTLEQERELQIALQHLDRCQKAWSSEQEVWLAYIKTLNDEKEAHMDFLRLRTKQQDDERVYFRKAWSRRRPSEPLDKDASGNEGDVSDDATNGSGIRRTQSRLMRLRRFSTSSFVSSG